MLIRMLSTVFVLGLLSCTSVDAADQWRQLFNGRDLSGWTPKIRGEQVGVNYADTFRVEDGILKVRYDKYEGPLRGKMGHLFTDESFSHYRVRVECRSVGDQYQGGPDWGRRNNGVLIHGQSAQSMALHQVFPVSLEVQALAGLDDGNSRPAGNVCTPGTHVLLSGKLYTPHCAVLSEEHATIPHGEWMTIEAEVRGNDLIRHFVNGKKVIEYTKPILDENDIDAKRLLAAGAKKQLASGTISIQAESAPYDFRNIEILEFPQE